MLVKHIEANYVKVFKQNRPFKFSFSWKMVVLWIIQKLT